MGGSAARGTGHTLAAGEAAGVPSAASALPEGGAGVTRLIGDPVRAGGWSGASFILANVIGSLIYIPLARLLDRPDFGLFTEANLAYLALTTVAEGAVVQALVQARGDAGRLAAAAPRLSAVLGLAGCLLCLAAGPLMAGIYGDGALTGLLLLMAPGVLLSGLGAAPHAWLSRDLDFRRKTLPETVSIAAGGVVGLAGAIAGLGVYSLALMAVTTAATSTAVAWWICRDRLRGALGRDGEMRRLVGNVAVIGGGDLALYARLNTDYALSGRILGTDALGVYSLAWNSSVGPQLFILAFAGRVGFALFARLQGDIDGLRRVFISGVRLVAVAALPVMLGAVVVTPDLVPVLLGSKWTAAVTPLMVLFVLQLVRTVCAPGASLILAMGHNRLYAVVGLAGLPATVVAVLAGTRWGVTGVSVAMLGAVGSVSVAYLVLALRLLRAGVREVAHVLALPLLLTVASLPVVGGARALLIWGWDAPAAVRLAAAIGAGTLAYLAALRLLWPALAADIVRVRRALPEDTAAGLERAG